MHRDWTWIGAGRACARHLWGSGLGIAAGVGDWTTAGLGMAARRDRSGQLDWHSARDRRRTRAWREEGQPGDRLGRNRDRSNGVPFGPAGELENRADWVHCAAGHGYHEAAAGSAT